MSTCGHKLPKGTYAADDFVLLCVLHCKSSQQGTQSELAGLVSSTGDDLSLFFVDRECIKIAAVRASREGSRLLGGSSRAQTSDFACSCIGSVSTKWQHPGPSGSLRGVRLEHGRRIVLLLYAFVYGVYQNGKHLGPSGSPGSLRGVVSSMDAELSVVHFCIRRLPKWEHLFSSPSGFFPLPLFLQFSEQKKRKGKKLEQCVNYNSHLIGECQQLVVPVREGFAWLLGNMVCVVCSSIVMP